MAKTQGSDAYKKLVRILIVLFVLVVLCCAGYILMDQSINAQVEENNRRAAEENAQLMAQYQQAKAEEEAKKEQGESIQWPTPKAEGWDVLDLTDYPITTPLKVSATRQSILMNGMLLLNHWHSLPADFPESELLSVYTVDKNIPVSGSDVKLFPEAITALSRLIADAKEDGMEGFLVDEGYRDMAKQTEYYDEAAANYADSLYGAALEEKVRQSVNVPGTSEYQSGLSFRMDRYLKNNPDFMSKKFYELELSDWLLENCWEYGFVFRFPVEGYPNETMQDKSYKTGESKKLSIYRYVGVPHATAMHLMDMCMEEYVEYLVLHPHIAIYENGQLRYEITRIPGGNTAADVTVEISRSANDYSISYDNMGGLIVSMSY